MDHSMKALLSHYTGHTDFNKDCLPNWFWKKLKLYFIFFKKSRETKIKQHENALF